MCTSTYGLRRTLILTIARGYRIGKL
jgi:hypothetical protein